MGSYEPEVLFCPFCRESFEGLTHCPEHELALVPFDRLPPDPALYEPIDEHAPVAPFSLRHGRGVVAAGSGLMLVGFFAPLVRTALDASSYRGGAGPAVASAFDLAITQATNLWMIPSVALGLLALLGRRRTLVHMRQARLALMAIALIGGASLIYSFAQIARATREIAERTGYVVDVSPLWGAYLISLGVAVASIGGGLLGRSR